MSTKERPIIFSTPMVRAILEGKKTQTRRVVKPQPPDGAHPFFIICSSNEKDEGKWRFTASKNHMSQTVLGPVGCPYGKPGDRLWVRETFYRWTGCGQAPERFLCIGGPQYCYADDPEFGVDRQRVEMDTASCVVTVPSIFMPRWASRITLEITGVRVERLQQISEADAMAEGCPLVNPDPFVRGHGGSSASGWFSELWESINGAGSWDANPWVWVVEFQRVEVGP